MARFVTTVESSATPEAAFDLITSYDVISVAAISGGSAVTYDADLRLHGARRIFDLPLLAAFRVIGRRAESGMRRELAKAGKE